jgi:hypothetical protein
MFQKPAVLPFSDDRDWEIHLLWGPLELLLVTGFRLPVCFASVLLQRMDIVQKKGVSECCTTLSELYGIDMVDV